ncbi:hypothetical protein [Massilia pseudoviolaceinigra]|uniref:hypothetical protein n=1 Tax=Massilia pseudoviolaceinigra TaxID=3057165 RepID=UPI002796D98E|nr:hypothetical protein [Massilia sp. CCM 9206]MDQ1922858.1 hypothetical protein [Massilia sp. CCM 9206]
MLPLVFYNGSPYWSASAELAGLLMQAPASLLALLFRLDLSLFPDVSTNVLPALTTWFKEAPQASLRRSVQVWVNGLLARATGNSELFMVDSAEEDADMGGKLATWAEQLAEIGIQKGFASAEKAKEDGKAEGQVIALRGCWAACCAAGSAICRRRQRSASPGPLRQSLNSGSSAASVRPACRRCLTMARHPRNPTMSSERPAVAP